MGLENRTGFVQRDIRNYLLGVDCVLAYETASDYLGTNCMGDRPSYTVYSLEELNLDGVECIIVDSYDNLDIVEKLGIRTTSEQYTLFDLLRNDRDPQVIIEAMADWYFRHGNTYDNLDVPEDIREIFDDYAEDAPHYYDD